MQKRVSRSSLQFCVIPVAWEFRSRRKTGGNLAVAITLIYGLNYTYRYMEETVKEVLFETRHHASRPYSSNYPPQQQVLSVFILDFIDWKYWIGVLIEFLYRWLVKFCLVKLKDGGRGSLLTYLPFRGIFSEFNFMLLFFCWALVVCWVLWWLCLNGNIVCLFQFLWEWWSVLCLVQLLQLLWNID